MTLPPHAESRLTLDDACEITRTGDIWIFRGDSSPTTLIRLLTNAPVNHVGMAVVLDDMPPLMWHAELGKGLLDMWTGQHQRGVQLHDLREAVVQWTGRYEQHAWLRQLDMTISPEMEDQLLRTVAQMDGTPFPSTASSGRAAGPGPAGSPVPSSPTAPRSWPRRTPRWGCSGRAARPTPTTPGSSGPATTWSLRLGARLGARSGC